MMYYTHIEYYALWILDFVFACLEGACEVVTAGKVLQNILFYNIFCFYESCYDPCAMRVR